jgi:hypothetical protein
MKIEIVAQPATRNAKASKGSIAAKFVVVLKMADKITIANKTNGINSNHQATLVGIFNVHLIRFRTGLALASCWIAPNGQMC